MKRSAEVGEVVFAKVSGMVRMVKIVKGGLTAIKGINLSTNRMVTLKSVKAIRGVAGRI